MEQYNEIWVEKGSIWEVLHELNQATCTKDCM